MSRATLACIALLYGQTALFAQGSAGSAGKLEPRFIVDMPTAGMLGKGTFGLDVDFYQEGGLLVGMSVGAFERLLLGVSYGGSGLIGASAPVMDETPGVQVKVRILEESTALPALAIGFDSQGRDGYIRTLSRYTIKSPGLYAVVSKNYLLLGYLSVHGGVNYSFERADGDRDPNLFAGVEKTIGPFVSILLEYNAAINDNSGDSIGRGRGYLNGALRWSIGGGLTLGVHLKDLTRNGSDVTVANRTVRLEYVRPF